jgi:hypothetical protein
MNYGNVVFSTVDSASQRLLNFYALCSYISRLEHVSNLVPSIIGVSLAIHLRIHLLTFLFKFLHISTRVIF